MRARILWFGSIELGDTGVTISRAFGSERIPYSRIASVSGNKATGRVTIETGAQTRTVQLWNGTVAPDLANAISNRLPAAV